MIPNRNTRVVYLSREHMCFSAEAYKLLELTLAEFQILESLGVALTFGGVRYSFGVRDTSTSTTRKRLRFRADNYECVSCGAAVKNVALYWENNRIHARFICDNGFWLTIDHKTRKREGGTLAFKNIETLCFKCNQARENVDVRLKA